MPSLLARCGDSVVVQCQSTLGFLPPCAGQWLQVAVTLCGTRLVCGLPLALPPDRGQNSGDRLLALLWAAWHWVCSHGFGINMSKWGQFGTPPVCSSSYSIYLRDRWKIEVEARSVCRMKAAPLELASVRGRSDELGTLCLQWILADHWGYEMASLALTELGDVLKFKDLPFDKGLELALHVRTGWS